MIIEPKIRGFICTTAHPAGCEKNILDNIDYLDKNQKINIPDIKTALVIGASTGYGLASALTASFSLGAGVIAVALEKNAKNNRTATAGMYNLAAYKKQADARGLYVKPVIADAFSNKAKETAGEIIKNEFGAVDLLVYSIAAPARIDPVSGTRYASVLKPIGKEYKSKGIDLSDYNNYKINEVSVPPASEKETEETIKVMGGEDLGLWTDYLQKNNLMRESAVIIAYSYTGPALTHDIYLNGTVGAAKNHLKQTSAELNKLYKVKSYTAAAKAIVTQASSAIPVMPLYISILFKVMKEKNLHEGCAEQIYRLFKKLGSDQNLTDENGFIRTDDLEMREDVQREVAERWAKTNDGNLGELADLDGYRADFIKLFGFGLEGIDYSAESSPEVDEAALGFINLTD